MPLDRSLFLDVASAVGLNNPAIVEKDYYVVQLLKIVNDIDFKHHLMVFSGGTALAKSSIKTCRMSEDVDIKLVPQQLFHELPSREAKKRTRKELKKIIEAAIDNSSTFSMESEAIVRDEYRYMCFDVRYPQEYKIAPCLRPFIKLEFIETEIFGQTTNRNISSIFAENLQYAHEVPSIRCTSILDTQAEKIISMLRRTASVARNIDRQDDPTLIRHIYDTYHIQNNQASDVNELAELVRKVIDADKERYGRQHAQFVDNPCEELLYGLSLLSSDKSHQSRYEEFVNPMVYATQTITWSDAFSVFESLTKQIINKLSQ